MFQTETVAFKSNRGDRSIASRENCPTLIHTRARIGSFSLSTFPDTPTVGKSCVLHFSSFTADQYFSGDTRRHLCTV